FSVLGYFAWLFPLVLMLKTVLVFQNRYQPMVWNGWLFALRAFGFILLLCSGAALTHVHFPLPEITPKNFNILGETLGEALTAVLNIEGATLLLLACFLFGLTVYANFSWFKVMEGVGALTLRAAEAVKSFVQKVWDNAQTRKQTKLKLREVDEQVSQVTGSLRADKVEQARVRDRVLKRDEALAQHVSAREGRREPVIAAPSAAQAAPAPSKRVQKEKQAPLFVDSAIEGTLPPLALLDKAEKKKPSYSEESLQAMSRLLEIKLKEFGVEVQVDSVHPGPVVTRFE
ncbi:MAG TPA: cell division protein FtsK, partial [Pseudomonas sp.]|nr:cell division protein FtsK [Pseudomonas sp.]